MQYKCITKVKGFIFAKFRIDDIITVKKYNDLSVPDKSCFTVDYSDENFWQQWERDQEIDDKNSNN